MSTVAPNTAEVRQALYDLGRYFSDELAPLMAVDSVEVLLGCPPQLVASQIRAWVESQYRQLSSGVPVSDCIYHALKKIHLMSEFELIGHEQLERYLKELGGLVLEFCPADERESLQQSLGSLGETAPTHAAAVQMLHRTPAREVGPTRSAAAVNEDLSRSLKRLGLLVERLAADGKPLGAGDVGRTELVGQILATAAGSSRSGAELETALQRLGDLGLDNRMDQIFRNLSRSLPSWTPPPQEGGQPAQGWSRPVEAMHRLISLAPDQAEGASRFSEMMRTAVEAFNEGRLPQAASMFELAERLIAEKKIDGEMVKSLRQRAHEALSEEQFRLAVELADKHPALRKVLAFFPALSPNGLLDQLHGEQARARRKLLLALLEIEGAPARQAALDRLASFDTGGAADPQGFFQRNLVFLLRRIPRPAGATTERELPLLDRLSRLGNPMIVVREAIPALVGLPPEEAERPLAARLDEIEKALLAGGRDPAATEELLALLDRTTGALARAGTLNARRILVAHGFKEQPQLGHTMGRLAELQGQDLSGDRQLVESLLEALQQELPRKVLGFTVHKNNPNLLPLVLALSGTNLPAVRQQLEEVGQRFREQDFGQAATRALATLGSGARPAEEEAQSLSGDIELFGLPNLLQSLADSQVTGVLTLNDRDNRGLGTVLFESGKVRGCRAAKLSGETALYQLFERPAGGSFVFKRRRDLGGEPTDPGPPIDVLSCVLEALRRHDELQLAQALVPDQVQLKATEVNPTVPDGEDDSTLVRAVWSEVSAGATPEACEASVATDAYRIRRLLAHWVEEGALRAA
ncbi:MAG TPA: DUF4388 domain-containing protein [Candidatus Polarisedimenticolaceae bacterium]|nr:DUF4388 domain-containing protein [Candidatus Polarisedimenticolaceae bacterium]